MRLFFAELRCRRLLGLVRSLKTNVLFEFYTIIPSAQRRASCGVNSRLWRGYWSVGRVSGENILTAAHQGAVFSAFVEVWEIFERLSYYTVP